MRVERDRMSANKKSIRDKFRSDVFSRDGHRCLVCGSTGKLDAHHVTDRSDMPNGGYVSENGITLCGQTSAVVNRKLSCHEKAELWHASGKTKFSDGFRPEDLYKLIGSSYEKAVEASKRPAPPSRSS
jgi:predicted restriction endonuclease